MGVCSSLCVFRDAVDVVDAFDREGDVTLCFEEGEGADVWCGDGCDWDYWNIHFNHSSMYQRISGQFSHNDGIFQYADVIHSQSLEFHLYVG